MTWQQIYLTIWLIVNLLLTIARIGKPRPLATPGYAIASFIEIGVALAVIWSM